MNTALVLPTLALSAIEQAAAVHSARLQTALLAVRARRVVIAAVRAGWWAHHSADVYLPEIGLPRLPMIWPAQVRLPLRHALFAADAESAITKARRDITTALQVLLDRDDPLLALTIDAATIDTAQPDETDGHHYLVDATAVIAVPVTAADDRHALTIAADQAATRLAGHPHLTLRRPPDSALPADLCHDDLDAPVLDPDTDGPELTELQHVLADPLHNRPAPATPAAAVATLQRLQRGLRSRIIDAIGDGIGIRAGDDPYAMADQILTAMGLDPLPRSWQYHITVTITHAVTANTVPAALAASYDLLRDISPACPQKSLPIANPDTIDPRPQAEPAGPGCYRVTRQVTYLVCLRGTDSPALAEAAVRQQLSIGDPGFGTAPLNVHRLGQRVDPILNRHTD